MRLVWTSEELVDPRGPENHLKYNLRGQEYEIYPSGLLGAVGIVLRPHSIEQLGQVGFDCVRMGRRVESSHGERL